MFERFLAKFEPDAPTDLATAGAGVQEWLEVAGGRTFAGGVYRAHSESSAGDADRLVGEGFDAWSGRIRCFGYDWLGRQFAVEADDQPQAGTRVLMFEPGTGEVLVIPVGFSQFHDEELVDFTNDALAANFFAEWLRAGGARPSPSECVGYRVPLFLGGKDVVGNLETTEMSVYWDLTNQLRQGVAGLPMGTPISEVRLD